MEACSVNDTDFNANHKCSQENCDTGTNSPHQVAFAPQAAKASNCQYFAVTAPRIQCPFTAILLLKNPGDSKTILYVTIESISNYGCEAVTAHLAEGIETDRMRCYDVEILQSNLGCHSESAAEACFACLSYTAALCGAKFLTRDIVGAASTLRIDHQGGFVVTPGENIAIVVTGIHPSDAEASDGFPNLDVGLDIRWWETPCNSHT